ncbi:aminopeptidase P family protein [Flavobacteriaceae bacterium]|jgi:Xaa-Pro aminopeptidase|nr:aminopeptidase P family protein [Flavobacteriaceae bacterium]MDB2336482.1 aminopeptidase P family protein [Flavobacteriaceae bacterium]MDB2625357.1 aminopeptidase P family protein [Flavobacteriaceae bacterium]MDG1161642.1 M24 family metallopeptidase [Flavobacteriaceae bacterium]|tara:strand:+ start:4661 stop:5980 length:1320 start_codon:yes stop_codon:yes gene_type:complete
MRTVLSIILFLSIQISFAQIVSEKERAILKDELLEDRFQNLLPQLMDDADLDMWLLISREYNEDPVLKTMLPATWLNARRRTMILFYRNKEQNTMERIAVARYDIGKSIKSAWNKELEPNQWKALSAIIAERNPNKIGINYSKNFALADGLVKTDYEELLENLPDSLTSKLVSAEKLAIAWIETRTEKEMNLFKKLVTITHDIIDDAFSEKVIIPGKTTTEDVVWFMRQKVTDMGLETWFHPTIDLQRSNQKLKSHIYSFSKGDTDKVIQKGDLLHCDFGITYIGLNTDCQQHAYVLKDEETEVPEFLAMAFKKGNRLQDILTTTMQEGKTGNEILLSSLATAKSEGLRPSIYTHPLGKYGHSAGTTIGMWDSQGGVPFKGDYSLHKNTAYAIELNVTVTISEWQKDIRIMLEEAGFYGDNFFEYVNERQTEIKPIKVN